MHVPAPKDRRRLAAQRRAGRTVTRGVEEEIDRLHELDPAKRAVEVGAYACLYAAGAALATHAGDSAALLLLSILCMGATLNAMGVLLHDGLHGLLARHPIANHLFTFLVGAPLMLSATAYQITHANHHFELGRKPDYGTYRQHLQSPGMMWVAYLLQLLAGTLLYVVLIPPLAFASASGRTKAIIVLECGAIAAGFAAAMAYAPAGSFLLYWGYPAIVAFFLTNVRGLGSHALGDMENIYLSSRTIEGSALTAMIFLHENYHLEHHLFPRVPSYNLARVHALVWDKLPEALYAPSYWRFLLGFFGAAWRRDLSPMGVVKPAAGPTRTPGDTPALQAEPEPS